MAERTIALPQHIRIATPCPVSWDAMQETGASRWCRECGLHVHDLSRVSAAEAATLVRSGRGRVCVNSYTSSTGGLLTRDDRWELLRIRVARHAVRVAALLGLGSVVGLLSGCIFRTGGVVPVRNGGSALRGPESPPAGSPGPAPQAPQ